MNNYTACYISNNLSTFQQSKLIVLASSALQRAVVKKKKKKIGYYFNETIGLQLYIKGDVADGS